MDSSRSRNGSVCSRAPQRGCLSIRRLCGRAVLRQEQCRDGKDYGCDEDQALQRCGQGLRRDDGAAPPGCHRHGRSRAELWTRRTAAPPRPGNKRHSAGGDGGDAARARQRGCLPVNRTCGSVVLSQERYCDDQDDGCDEDQALQRRRQGLRRDDGAPSPGRHRHGRSRAELWTQRAAARPRPGNHRHSAAADRGDAARSRRATPSVRAIVPSAIFEQHAPAVVSLDAYAVCLCHRRPHMKRRFFTILLATTALVLALLTTTTLVTTPSAWAGQVPFGTATSPDIPVSHRDRVYTADQWSNTVTVTDPVDNKLLGVIRLVDPTPANLSPLYYVQLLVHA